MACMTITLQHKFPNTADKHGDPKLVRTLEQNMSFNFDENADDFWNEFNHSKTPWERKAEILFKIAGIEARDGNLPLELTYLRNAIDMAAAHDLREQRFKYLNVLSSRAMYGKSDYELALQAADEVLEALPGFNPEIDVMEWVGTAYCNKGRSLMGLKRFDEAIPALKAALDYAELIRDVPETAHTNLGLMRCYIEVQLLEEAKRYGSAARKIYQDRAQLASMCETDRLFARISILEGNPVRAKSELKEVRVLEQRLFHFSSPETKLFLGIAYLELDKFEKAEQLFDRLFDKNLQPWAKEFDIALQAAGYLSQALYAQGKHDEVARVELQRIALSKRMPGVTRKEKLIKLEESRGLRQAGKLDLAKRRLHDFLEEVNTDGDIELHWQGILEEAFICRAGKDYEGILKLWDENFNKTLEYQDQVVILLKNLVTHALQKLQRHTEALALNNEVLRDSRTLLDQDQHGYALENAARINKDLEKTRIANKFKEQTLEKYISQGKNDRALELIEYFKKK